MKKALSLIFAAVLLGPPFAQAYTLQSTTVSSANSGGVTANSGESITAGDSNAYSEVHTTIIGNSASGGTSTVYVKTNTNGVVHEETTVNKIPPGGAVVVRASAHAGTTTARSYPAAFAHHASTTSHATSSDAVTPAIFGHSFLHTLWHAWASFFGWFGR